MRFASLTRTNIKLVIPKFYNSIITNGRIIRFLSSSNITDCNIMKKKNRYINSNNTLITCTKKSSIENNFSLITLQKRYINDNSWASDRLKELGENIETGPEIPSIEATEEILVKPSPKVQKLIDEILSLNMLEVNQLVTSIQTRLGVTDEALSFGGGGGGGKAAAAAAPEAAPEPVKEKEAFDIKLTVVDAKAKIKIIKEVRAITGLGLKEAKDLVEKAPVVLKQGLKKDEAENFKKILLEAGAQVEIL